MGKQSNGYGLQYFLLILLILSVSWVGSVFGETRIKDITTIRGLSSEKLIGYGLIVGLNATGDGRRAAFTQQSLVSLLERLGVTVDPSELRVENVAAVIVTAEMDPFADAGSRVDATVSSVGDASSLDGGVLLMTPLKAMNGVVYAVAQGPISTGGFSIDTGPGSSVSSNPSTVGLVVDGVLIQRGLERKYVADGTIRLSLMHPDFRTMNSMLQAINGAFGAGVAQGIDAKNMVVKIPQEMVASPVTFIAQVEQLAVIVDVAARVVINERTGTIVIGAGVEVGEAAIAHGSLQVEIHTDFEVSQAQGFAPGSTVVIPKVSAWVDNPEARIFALKESSTVGNIAQALNEIGATPRDIVAIFQALKRAGALRGQLIIM